MPTNLVVNNNVFAYPSPGDEPGWGQPATGWAEEVTEVLNDLVGADDILETTFNISNNQASPLDIVGLSFNTATVRSALVDYSIYITTDTNEVAERGQLELIFKNGGTVGQKWTIVRDFIGDDAGLTITVTDAGQAQYTSTNISGTGYTGVMRFEAIVTQQ